jgi:zinc protease
VEFAQARVDGNVPVFWTQAGDELTAGLVFRVGRADERLARGGITHLVEHLALHPLGVSARMDCNGQVDALTTTFVTRGTPEEVADFFNAVCASLRELPMGRLEAEKQVLRTEADMRRPVISDPLLIGRYGADTYGLSGYPEYGIGAFQAQEVRAWAGQHFTRGNAALWVAGGPPPSGLRLDLPDGSAMPPPQPARTETRTPGWVNAPVQGVGWSGLVRRSTPAQVYASVLGRRLLQELRHKQGLAYSPRVSYAVRDADMAHVIAAADGLPEVHSILVSAFILELERLEAAEITEEELISTVESMRAAAETSRGAAGRVTVAARNAIMGRPAASDGAGSEGLAPVSAAAVHAVAKEAFSSSLFVLPPKRRPFRAGFTALGGSAGPAVAGREIRRADFPLDQATLVIGADGVSAVRGQAVDTVLYAACAALLTWPDGARRLISRDGVSIRVEPTLWRLEDHAARIEDSIGADRRVSMPSRPAQAVPLPWTRRPDRIAGWMLVGPRAVIATGAAPIAVLFVLVLLLASNTISFGAIILVWPAMALGVVNARLARVRLLKRAAKRNAEQRF